MHNNKQQQSNLGTEGEAGLRRTNPTRRVESNVNVCVNDNVDYNLLNLLGIRYAQPVQTASHSTGMNGNVSDNSQPRHVVQAGSSKNSQPSSSTIAIPASSVNSQNTRALQAGPLNKFSQPSSSSIMLPTATSTSSVNSQNSRAMQAGPLNKSSQPSSSLTMLNTMLSSGCDNIPANNQVRRVIYAGSSQNPLQLGPSSIMLPTAISASSVNSQNTRAMQTGPLNKFSQPSSSSTALPTENSNATVNPQVTRAIYAGPSQRPLQTGSISLRYSANNSPIVTYQIHEPTSLQDASNNLPEKKLIIRLGLEAQPGQASLSQVATNFVVNTNGNGNKSPKTHNMPQTPTTSSMNNKPASDSDDDVQIIRPQYNEPENHERERNESNQTPTVSAVNTELPTEPTLSGGSAIEEEEELTDEQAAAFAHFCPYFLFPPQCEAVMRQHVKDFWEYQKRQDEAFVTHHVQKLCVDIPDNSPSTDLTDPKYLIMLSALTQFHDLDCKDSSGDGVVRRLIQLFPVFESVPNLKEVLEKNLFEMFYFAKYPQAKEKLRPMVKRWAETEDENTKQYFWFNLPVFVEWILEWQDEPEQKSKGLRFPLGTLFGEYTPLFSSRQFYESYKLKRNVTDFRKRVAYVMGDFLSKNRVCSYRAHYAALAMISVPGAHTIDEIVAKTCAVYGQIADKNTINDEVAQCTLGTDPLFVAHNEPEGIKYEPNCIKIIKFLFMWKQHIGIYFPLGKVSKTLYYFYQVFMNCESFKELETALKVPTGQLRDEDLALAVAMSTFILDGPKGGFKSLSELAVGLSKCYKNHYNKTADQLVHGIFAALRKETEDNCPESHNPLFVYEKVTKRFKLASRVVLFERLVEYYKTTHSYFNIGPFASQLHNFIYRIIVKFIADGLARLNKEVTEDNFLAGDLFVAWEIKCETFLKRLEDYQEEEQEE